MRQLGYLLAVLAGLFAIPSWAMDSSFTYQGFLEDGSMVAHGAYDFEFALYTSLDGDTQVGAIQSAGDVEVVNGVFSTTLDFGPLAFTGPARYLEVRVRPGASSSSHSVLGPRHKISAAPYAQLAESAVFAASIADHSVTEAKIAPGAVGTSAINSAQVQRRVAGGCPAGSAIAQVDSDGSVSCASGLTGPAGPAGPAGPEGPMGPAGPTGPAGTAGQEGPAGPPGLAGPVGPAGPAGPTGPTGAQGAVGAAGPAGPTGPAGPAGPTGAQGPQGLQGPAGATGPTGPQGPEGPAGPQGPAGSADAWGRLGNAGTSPASNFIGTTDAQPLVIRTANVRSLRIEPSTQIFSGAPITVNMIGGSHANQVTAGVRGATIAGGGVPSGLSDPVYTAEAPNVVTDHYGSVGGGYGNRAGDNSSLIDSPFATVGGGLGNTAGGARSTVGGGEANLAGGEASAVAGGSGNTASGSHALVAGGLDNLASGDRSAVGGGSLNCAGAPDSWAGGRRAKVRPGSSPTVTGSCSGLTYPGGNGDEGTFIWADSQDTNFVSTGKDRFLIRAQGGVGINTNAPNTGLDIRINKGSHAMDVYNLNTGANADGIAVRINVATPGSGNSFVSFQRDNGLTLAGIRGNGAGGVVYSTSGADYAEYLPLADHDLPPLPGQVVAIRAGKVTLDTTAAEQLAVVSANPAVAGNDPGEEHHGRHALVAFIGQVDVLVTGPVRTGDFLVASGRRDGRAIAVPPQHMRLELIDLAIGRAWSANPAGPGSVRALVGLNPINAAQSVALQRLAEENATLREQSTELRVRLDHLETLIGVAP